MKHSHITIGPYWSLRKLQRVPAHTISYLEFGDQDNANVVFCVHGLSRNAYDFDYLARHLAKDYRVIAVDMAGRGDSQRFKHKKYYNYDTYVKDVLLLLHALHIPKVDYIGTSMGGLIGMALATYYPKVIKSLVINDVGPELPNETLGRIRKYVALDPTFDTMIEAERHIRMIFKHCGIVEDEHWKHVTIHSVYLDEDKKYRLKYDPMVISGGSKMSPGGGDKQQMMDLWYLWKKVQVPVLLIHGIHSDILLNTTMEKMRTFRTFDFHEIDAGHAPALVQDSDNQVIHDWLLARKG